VNYKPLSLLKFEILLVVYPTDYGIVFRPGSSYSSSLQLLIFNTVHVIAIVNLVINYTAHY
jgi:hypothetical protein